MVTFHLLFDILRLLEILSEVEICDPIMYKICIKHISKYIDANLRCGVTPSGINTFILGEIIPILN